MKIPSQWIFSSLLFFSGVAGATVQKCGDYTIKASTVETSSGYPMRHLNVARGGKVVMSFSDSSVGMQWCRDVTGDGTPEMVITAYAGPSGTYRLYSMGSTPRLIRQGSVYGDGFDLTPVQLDGKGALELVMSAQWLYERYADEYRLDDFRIKFPEILQWNGRQYVTANRQFPAIVAKRTLARAPQSKADILSAMLGLYSQGRDSEVQGFLNRIPNSQLRQWGEGMKSRLKQDAALFDLKDWPLRYGFSPKTEVDGAMGGFTAPGREEFLAVVKSKDSGPGVKAGEAALMLFSKGQDGQITGQRLPVKAVDYPLVALPWFGETHDVQMGDTIYRIENGQLIPSPHPVMQQASHLFNSLTQATNGTGATRQQARQAVQGLMAKQIGMGSVFSPLTWEEFYLHDIEFLGIPDATTHHISADASITLMGQRVQARINIFYKLVNGKWVMTEWFLT